MKKFRLLSATLVRLDIGEIKRNALVKMADAIANAARARAGSDISIAVLHDDAGARIFAHGEDTMAREFGTHTMRPRPFLAPAAALAPELATDLAAELARAVAELS